MNAIGRAANLPGSARVSVHALQAGTGNIVACHNVSANHQIPLQYYCTTVYVKVDFIILLRFLRRQRANILPVRVHGNWEFGERIGQSALDERPVISMLAVTLFRRHIMVCGIIRGSRFA